jgi:hypothetical protein
VTLAEFRKSFDDIVARHGWSYKGGRDWRTSVILNTNVRTAYAAGRYKQMTEPSVKKSRPYWEYRHGGSAHPRLEHLAWDGLVLPADDPWWAVHYPPNGWGCKCRVFAIGQRDLDRMGKDGPDQAPADLFYEWKDRKTGEVFTVPKGIDPGWDYNVGESAGRSYKVLAEKFETMDPDIAKPWMKEFLDGPVFQRFFTSTEIDEFPVAVLTQADRAVLGGEAQTVWLSRNTLDKHLARHPEMEIRDYRKIPEILETGEVYKRGDARLVYLKDGDKLYRATLKRTEDGRENYFLTLFATTETSAENQVRRKLERVR